MLPPPTPDWKPGRLRRHHRVGSLGGRAAAADGGASYAGKDGGAAGDTSLEERGARRRGAGGGRGARLPNGEDAQRRKKETIRFV
jgi:hypothetical protein